MRQISGNKLFVKALKEEDVEVLFGYPGACTIDISDELYKQSGIDVILPRHEQHWCMKRMRMRGQRGKSASVW